MTELLFYHPLLSSDEVTLDPEESSHCVRSYRRKKGDLITLVDGKGKECQARIESDDPKNCKVRIEECRSRPKNRSYDLHIAIAPVKQTARMEWFVEKAVEFGIDKISFMDCERSERSHINMERMQRLAVAAMKQSRQFWMPEIAGGKSFDEMVSDPRDHDLKLIAAISDKNRVFKDALDLSKKRLLVLIGPEGDFSKEEIDLALANKFVPVSLGENILRTETAGIYACAAVKALLS